MWYLGRGRYNEVDEYDISKIWAEVKFCVKSEVFVKDEAEVESRDSGVECIFAKRILSPKSRNSVK